MIPQTRDALCRKMVCPYAFTLGEFFFFFLRLKFVCDPTAENALGTEIHHFSAQKISDPNLNVSTSA